jgi:hypothetical protein
MNSPIVYIGIAGKESAEGRGQHEAGGGTSKWKPLAYLPRSPAPARAAEMPDVTHRQTFTLQLAPFCGVWLDPYCRFRRRTPPDRFGLDEVNDVTKRRQQQCRAKAAAVPPESGGLY